MREREQARSPGLSMADRARYALARLRCRVSRVGVQMRRLGRWLEEDLCPAADKVNEETLTLIPGADGSVAVEHSAREEAPSICDCHELTCSCGGWAASNMTTRKARTA